MAAQTQNDGFHEIQLNGKQLVFLFMAATVVSVVIFLCGVLVGRGVRAERALVDGLTEVPAAELPASRVVDSAAAATSPAADTAKAPRDAEELSYFKRLERRSDPVEDLKPQPASKRETGGARTPSAAPRSELASKTKATQPSNTQAQPARPAAGTSIPKAESSDALASAAPPTGRGYAVQIAALNARGEADAIARRLTAKGYAAYVLSPTRGSPAVYRVRVGAFKTRREAESVAARLQKEESVKPWVTR